ncbi:hypothetical protein J7K86_01205 [bacterium]|nr:hypothetical protein [bacterium]
MQIIGHQNIQKFLKLALLKDRLSHAYLFYGPELVGKKVVAFEFISNVLKKNISKKQFEIIKNQIRQGIYPGVYIVSRNESAKNITIEQIRDLRKKLGLGSLNKSYQFALIDDASEMSIAAANSFLKLLEEPPERAIIILITKNKNLLPRTIISRCQLLKFNLVPLKDIENFLINNFNLNRNKAEEIASLSFGRPGMAVRFIQDPEFLEDYRKEVKSFLEILDADIVKRFNFVQKRYQSPNFLAWQIALRDLLLLKQNIKPENKFCLSRLKETVSKISFKQICDIYSKLEKVRYYFNKNVNRRLIIENLFVNL